MNGERQGMTSGQPLAVDLRGLTKPYGELTAVRDLSMAIESGEIVAFLYRAARFSALITPRSDASTIDSLMPTPHSTRSPTSISR